MTPWTRYAISPRRRSPFGLLFFLFGPACTIGSPSSSKPASGDSDSPSDTDSSDSSDSESSSDSDSASETGGGDSDSGSATDDFPTCAPYSGFLAAGTAWSYTPREGEGEFLAEITAWSGNEVTRTEHKVVGDETFLQSSDGDFLYRCETDGLYLISSNTEEKVSIPSYGIDTDVWEETTYTRPVLIVPAELEPGDSFDQEWVAITEGSDGSVATSYYAVRYEVTDEEEVDVLAGTYTALRLTGSDYGPTWLVDGVGLVKDGLWELDEFDE